MLINLSKVKDSVSLSGLGREIMFFFTDSHVASVIRFLCIWVAFMPYSCTDV